MIDVSTLSVNFLNSQIDTINSNSDVVMLKRYSDDYISYVVDKFIDNQYNTNLPITPFEYEIKLPTIPDYEFIGNNNLVTITLNNTNSIGIGAFEYCTNLRYIKSNHNSSIKISLSSFANCTKLETVDAIFNNIPNRCFYNCHSLQSFNCNGSAIAIEDEAFSNCNELKSITGIYNVKHIGINAFLNCYSLNNITLGKQVETIDSYAFSGCGLTHITIPASVKYIETGAFKNNVKLKEVIFEHNIGDIIYFNNDAFKGCSNVRFINKNNNEYVNKFLAR